MKILITGAKGQLGKELMELLPTKGFEVAGFDRDDMDITDLEAVRTVFQRVRPDAVIHAAAYTQVDQAESDIDNAYLINGFGTRHVAIAAEEIGAKLCYIGTDYVFNGQSSVPYHEYDIPSPLGIYGKSKYAGEQMTQTLSSKYFIVRTAWVYGLYGHNFVKTMLKLAQDRHEVSVVHDQTGSPTFTWDLAQFLSELIVTEKYGIYHATNTGTCTWYEFACAIFEEQGLAMQVNPVTTDQFPRPAQRPAYSVLEHISIRANGFSLLRPWREALKDFLQRLSQFSNQ